MKNKLKYFDDKLDTQKFDWGEMSWVHEPSDSLTEQLYVALVKFFPHRREGKHNHFGEEQILYILNGSGLHFLNGEKVNISEGMVVYCQPYSTHEIINTGEEDLVFFVISTPAKPMREYHHISIASNEHIRDILGIEILENIQSHIGELVNLPLTIVDNNKNYITKIINMTEFCNMCKKVNICKNEDKVYEDSHKQLNNVFVCCNNILTTITPILVNNKVFGYIKCGHFVLNKHIDIEHSILNRFDSDLVSVQDLVNAYKKIPVVPKSRLYALEEAMHGASNLIAHLIESNLVEKELTEKNNEILTTKKEKIHLENELKQVNTKLLKSKVLSGFENYGFRPKFSSKRESLEYPFIYENKLKDAIKKLDENLSISIVMEIVNMYEKKGFYIEDAKEVFEELSAILSRVIYEETRDSEMFLKLRKRYKDKIRSCNNYDFLQNVMIEFSKESIIILKVLLLNGKFGLVNKINSYIKNNFRQNITLSYLAEMFFISPNYLSTIFNEENGMSLTDYINELRIEESKKYLLKTNIKISDISKMVGYNQVSYYGSIFKKLEGCTPKEYRDNLSENESCFETQID